MDDNYSSIAGLLTDVNPIVASDCYLILECKYDSNVDRINQVDCEIGKLLQKILNTNYNIVAISMDRWKIEKEKYLNNRKNGIVYNIINENKENKEDIKAENDDSLNKLVELLGEELIEYK